VIALGLGRLTLLLAADTALGAAIYGFSKYVVNQASSPLEILLPMLVVGPILGAFGAVSVNETINELLKIAGRKGDTE